MKYYFVFAALIALSGSCIKAEGEVSQDNLAPASDLVFKQDLSQSSLPDSASQDQQKQPDHMEQQKQKNTELPEVIKDLFSRMPDAQKEKAEKAYQSGLSKVSEKNRPQFLKEALDSLRWWKDVDEKYKAIIKQQTTASGVLDLDKEFMSILSKGNAKKVKNVRNFLEGVVKKAQKGEPITKKDVGEDTDKKSSRKKSKKKISLLEDYGYDSDAGDDYEEGDSLHQELEVDYSLDDDLDGFRVHDFQIDGDSIDTSSDWEEAKNNPWDGKKSTNDADDRSTDDADDSDDV
ncbi:MAG: hypothetical protein FJX00_03385 [Alphaproteobacteria bacterium]|nr:hypothetical protein [Alphaproteobacteria bacterium]